MLYGRNSVRNTVARKLCNYMASNIGGDLALEAGGHVEHSPRTQESKGKRGRSVPEEVEKEEVMTLSIWRGEEMAAKRARFMARFAV